MEDEFSNKNENTTKLNAFNFLNNKKIEKDNGNMDIFNEKVYTHKP